jgi:hypothetical protein
MIGTNRKINEFHKFIASLKLKALDDIAAKGMFDCCVIRLFFGLPVKDEFKEHDEDNLLEACARDAMSKSMIKQIVNPWAEHAYTADPTRAPLPPTSVGAQSMIEYDSDGNAKGMNQLSLYEQGFKPDVYVRVKEGCSGEGTDPIHN